MGPSQAWMRFLLRTSTKMPWMEVWTSIKIRKLGEINDFAYEDLILSINTSSCVRKEAFTLVKNVKSADFPE